jgi:hypothetical protein
MISCPQCVGQCSPDTYVAGSFNSTYAVSRREQADSLEATTGGKTAGVFIAIEAPFDTCSARLTISLAVGQRAAPENCFGQ